MGKFAENFRPFLIEIYKYAYKYDFWSLHSILPKKIFAFGELKILD